MYGDPGSSHDRGLPMRSDPADSWSEEMAPRKERSANNSLGGTSRGSKGQLVGSGSRDEFGGLGTCKSYLTTTNRVGVHSSGATCT